LFSFSKVGIEHVNNKPLSRSKMLTEARKKYFFNGPDAPNWRLLENEDDNGITIQEHELFRPIEMDDFTYNEKCEVLILLDSSYGLFFFFVYYFDLFVFP
jgi:hypothetical protein